MDAVGACGDVCGFYNAEKQEEKSAFPAHEKMRILSEGNFSLKGAEQKDSSSYLEQKIQQFFLNTNICKMYRGHDHGSTSGEVRVTVTIEKEPTVTVSGSLSVEDKNHNYVDASVSYNNKDDKSEISVAAGRDDPKK